MYVPAATVLATAIFTVALVMPAANRLGAVNTVTPDGSPSTDTDTALVKLVRVKFNVTVPNEPCCTLKAVGDALTVMDAGGATASPPPPHAVIKLAKIASIIVRGVFDRLIANSMRVWIRMLLARGAVW